MASTKGSQLQWRHGRRISIPSSPTVFERRSDDKVTRGDPNGSVDILSSTAADSPSLDLQIPSPIFDLPGLSSPVSVNDNEDNHGGFWDRRDKSKSRKSDDAARSPSVGTPASDGGYTRSSRLQHSDIGFRSSPLTNSNRDNFDTGKSHFFDRPSLTTRNISNISLSTDRSAGDDTGSSRTPATKKSRLNLLNPMSLLARRRSSQNSKLEDLNINPPHVPAIPDFDPSIRGNIVHDFSTPRARTPRRDAFPSSAPYQSGSSPAIVSSPPLHSPVFKEHFQDEAKSLQPNQTAYLHNKQLDAPSPHSLPAFAQKLPTRLPSEKKTVHDLITVSEIPQPDLPPPPPPKRTPSPVLDLPPVAALPKHMKSTSSRFSFQLSGQGSAAQEKILEDKHREHFSKKSVDLDDTSHAVEDDYDDFDPDAHDDFEEMIPGMDGFNDGDDEFGGDEVTLRDIEVQTSQMSVPPSSYSITVQDDFEGDDGFGNDDIPIKNIEIQSSHSQPNPLNLRGGQAQPKTLSEFHFTPYASGTSPTSTQQGSEPTPRDSEGIRIGVPYADYSSTSDEFEAQLPYKPGDDQQQVFFEGLRISTLTEDVPGQQQTSSANTFDDADLYFDDGEFDMENTDTFGEFDESFLDDGASQIRDIPAENAKRYEAALERSVAGDKIAVVNANGTELSRDTSLSSANVDILFDMKQHFSSVKAENTENSNRHESSGLTEDNLAAYHDALVMAASQAEASGRFNRQVSFSEKSSIHEDSPYDSSQTGLVSDESRFSLNYGSSGFVDDDNFGFDDDGMDDDLMIAEANAEALENDDDGFYGQEFGFYARARGKETSELLNGGYFSSRGSNGIKRSHSGKANFQEPSLTPITERSEWSARNSVASLPVLGGFPSSAHSLPSPGLNQLMDSPMIDDDMSFSALMKLRRGAFGGSSTSINSLADRSLPNSSPLAHVSNYSFPHPDPGTGRRMSNTQSLAGSMSIMESEEEGEDTGGRRTLTQNTPRKKVADCSPQTPLEQITANLSLETSVTRRGHHSRNSSGAESVSYSQDNTGRWVLERRRTGDDGEIELIGREYLAGARI